MSSQDATDQKTVFSTSPLSRSRFSRPLSRYCCGVQNVFLFALHIDSSLLLLMAYIKCYFTLLFPLFHFSLYETGVCVADMINLIVLNYAKAFVFSLFISLHYLFLHLYLSYSPFSTEV